jgi:hypothetical protein
MRLNICGEIEGGHRVAVLEFEVSISSEYQVSQSLFSYRLDEAESRLAAIKGGAFQK